MFSFSILNLKSKFQFSNQRLEIDVKQIHYLHHHHAATITPTTWFILYNWQLNKTVILQNQWISFGYFSRIRYVCPKKRKGGKKNVIHVLFIPNYWGWLHGSASFHTISKAIVQKVSFYYFFKQMLNIFLNPCCR